nr:splicing factor [Tanacetum cinerariifolium]
LWDYRQALLESNPGLTCRLEVEEVSTRSILLYSGWMDEDDIRQSLSVEPAPYVPTSDNAAKKKGKRTRSEPDVPFRIYHKNRGRLWDYRQALLESNPGLTCRLEVEEVSTRNLRQKQEKEAQDKLDEEALQQSKEGEFMFKRIDLKREREEQQWEAMLDPLNDYRFPDQEESMDVEM